MALIDRDATLERMKSMAGCATCDNYNGVRCRACIWDDAMNIVDEAPTIDAIPVEWLQYMQQECLSENDRTMVGAIEAIFIEWHIYMNRLREMNRQKEQEAQNG